MCLIQNLHATLPFIEVVHIYTYTKFELRYMYNNMYVMGLMKYLHIQL